MFRMLRNSLRMNITPHRESCITRFTEIKFEIWSVTFFKSFFIAKKYEMDGNISWQKYATIRDRLYIALLFYLFVFNCIFRKHFTLICLILKHVVLYL